jgi:hypothetical protein
MGGMSIYCRLSTFVTAVVIAAMLGFLLGFSVTGPQIQAAPTVSQLAGAR